MFTDPVQNVRAFGLRADSIVVDLGAGTGFYTLALAPLVPQGKVYAVEFAKDFLTTIQNKVAEEHFDNVEIIWGDVEKKHGTKIGDGVADAVVASNILFQVEDKDEFIQEIKRILRPKGKVLLVDWSVETSSTSGTKSPFAMLRGTLSRSEAQKLFEEQGFAWERYIDAGAHHYGMILVKS